MRTPNLCWGYHVPVPPKQLSHEMEPQLLDSLREKPYSTPHQRRMVLWQNACCVSSPVLYNCTAWVAPCPFVLKERTFSALLVAPLCLFWDREALDSILFPCSTFVLWNSSFPNSSNSRLWSLPLGFYYSVGLIWLKALHLEEESHLAHQLPDPHKAND